MSSPQQNENALSLDPVRRRQPRKLPAILAAMSLLMGLAVVPVAALPAAAPGPAPELASGNLIASGVVPEGVCYTEVEVIGGGGGGTGANAGGDGAAITVLAATHPTQPYSAATGEGGNYQPNKIKITGPAGGASSYGVGGDGGDNEGPSNWHLGGSGAGASVFYIGDLVDPLVVAAGGGGAGGGHAGGFGQEGGEAGIPVGSGVAPGTDGGQGIDGGHEEVVAVGGFAAFAIPGGQGGQATGPGAGGVHPMFPSLNGLPGVGTDGGKGGTGDSDLTPETAAQWAASGSLDSPGGGGGGYYGGGGGTAGFDNGGGDGDGDIDGPRSAGGGAGGGGASYVNAAASNGTAAPLTLVDAVPSGNGGAITTSGDDGSISATWVPCDYDLTIDKQASPTSGAAGETVSYTITVTNNGPDHMTLGDTVTINDDVASLFTNAPTNIVATHTTVGADSGLDQNGVTCSGALAALECFQDYSSSAADAVTAGGERGLDVGGVITITYDVLIDAADVAGTATNTATVTDHDGVDTATADVEIIGAEDDESLDNVIGTTVTVDPLGNDSGDLDPTTVMITDPATGLPVTSLVVPGEGTWDVDPLTGEISFTPEAGFEGNPTPISYTVEDVNGAETGADVVVTYLPEASPDTDYDNVIGTVVSVDPLANDGGDFDPTTVMITDPATGLPVTSLVVPGEGTWDVDPATGAISFTPEAGFEGNPTIIDYTVDTIDGETVGSTVEVTYLPVAAPDTDYNNVPGSTVTVDPLANDDGEFDATTVMITDPATGLPVTSLVVPGEGTWDVDPATGEITFTPEAGYEGNPTIIDYTVDTIDGETVGSTVEVTYVSVEPDESLGNTIGSTVTVDPLANDSGDFDPTTVMITDPATGLPVTSLVVPGEGTWDVDPATGEITFTPEAGYEGNPTIIDYTVDTIDGETVGSTVEVTYTPEAAPDTSFDNAIGTAVTVDPLGNDDGNFDPTTVMITDPATGLPVTSLVVPGEGTWDVDPATGEITFTPEAGFLGDPTIIDYTVDTIDGETVGSTAEVTYVNAETPIGDPDESLGNAIGSTVTIDVLGNDTTTDLDPTTVMIIDPATGLPVTSLAVPGEGTWDVDPVTGAISFTPESGFEGNPTPIEYIAADVLGVSIAAVAVTITYGEPAALPTLAFTGAESSQMILAALLAIGAGFGLASLSSSSAVARKEDE